MGSSSEQVAVKALHVASKQRTFVWCANLDAQEVLELEIMAFTQKLHEAEQMPSETHAQLQRVNMHILRSRGGRDTFQVSTISVLFWLTNVASALCFNVRMRSKSSSDGAGQLAGAG